MTVPLRKGPSGPRVPPTSGAPECVFAHILGATPIPVVPGLVGTQATFPRWAAGDAVLIECALTASEDQAVGPPWTLGLIPVVSFDGGATWNVAKGPDGNVQSSQVIDSLSGNLVVAVIVAVECPSAPMIGMFAYAPTSCQIIGGATIVATRVTATVPTGNVLVPYP